MLKKRLVFVLLYDNGRFMQSRNFRLQSVGDLEWLRENYDYDSIAYAIDELVVLDVSKEEKNIENFCKCLEDITKKHFMPIAAGGGIRSVEDADALFKAGADKIVLNTPYFTNEKLVKKLIEIFGMQSIVASIDYKKYEDNAIYIESGLKKLDIVAEDAIKYVCEVGAGELFLTSISDDGTGEGYDYDMLKEAVDSITIPVIANGGCGQFSQFVRAFEDCETSAAATADLFNFMGDGLQEARDYIIQQGITLAKWDMEYFKNKETLRA